MGLLKFVFKVAFLLLTLLILLFGWTFFIGGIVLAVTADIIGDLGSKIKDAVDEYVITVLPPSVKDVVYKKDEFLQLDIAGLIMSVCTSLSVFGGFFVILSIVGFTLAYMCPMKWMFYLIYLLVWAVIGIIYVAIAASLPSLVEKEIRDQLQTYKGFTDFSVPGITWTGIMVYFQCCGADNYRDFEKLEGWPDKKLDDVDLLPFISDAQRQVEHFKQAVEDLNKINGVSDLAKIQGSDIEALRNQANGIDVPNADKDRLFALKAELEKLPVEIDLKNLTMKLDTDEFQTPLACCKWDLENPDPQGRLEEGCNLKGKANATNNNMHISCLNAMSEFFDSDDYYNLPTTLTILGYQLFGFIVVYCIVIAVMAMLDKWTVYPTCSVCSVIV